MHPIPVIVFALGLLAGCAAMPAQELSDARQAIAAAEEIGAPVIAPTLMVDARARLEQAVAGLQRGDYEDSRRAAVAARRGAISARELASAIRAARAAIDPATEGPATSALRAAEQAARRGDVAVAREQAARALRLSPRR